MKNDKKGLRLPFEVDGAVDGSLVTAHAGVPLVAELFRASGSADVMDLSVRTKVRRRGLSVSRMSESFFSLWSGGGERCEDFHRLREDAALTALIGHEFPAANTARDFLDSFHEDDLPLLQSGNRAVVPCETEPLAGLSKSNGRLLAWSQERNGEDSATLDVDASIYASHKGSAKLSCEGVKGYQPVIAVWAEKDLIVYDEFRDGNVPAHSGNERVLRKAFDSLPIGVKNRYLRGDTALYEHGVLRYLDGDGVGYAISAVMTPELRAVVESVNESEWKMYDEESDAVRQWAEVEFFPNDGDHRKAGPVARRYLAIRIKKKQGTLFADGSDRRHFAVVTNLDWDGEEILRWHRKKAGTVEHVHDVMKNGLAAGAFPSNRFGANAAWFRLSVICYNLLSLLKREALPGEFQAVKPKRLRFLLLNTVGKVVQHARRTLLRLGTDAVRDIYTLARTQIHMEAIPLPGD